MANTVTLSGVAPDADVNAAYNWTPTIVAPGAYTVILTGQNLPPGLSLNMATGAISGTPNAVGVYQFSLTLVSGADSTTTSFTIRTNTAVVISGTPPAGKAGVIYNFTPTVTGGSTQYSCSIEANDLGFSVVDGTITGRPLRSGTLSLKFYVNDGIGVTTKSFLFDIEENTVVTITNEPTMGYVEQPYHWAPEINTTTSEPQFDLHLISGELPNGLTLDASTGVIEGVPTTDGNSTFEISISDGYTISEMTFSLRIVTQITLNALPGSGYVGELYSQTLSFSGGYPENYVFTFTKQPKAAYCPLAVDHNGIVSGTPLVAGAYTCVVSLTDGYTTATAEIRLTVRTPLTLKGVPDLGVVGMAYQFTPTASGGEGAYSFTTTIQPSNGISFNPKTGSIYGTPQVATALSGTVTVHDANTSVVLPVRLIFGKPTTYVIADRPEQFSGYKGVSTVNYSTVELYDPNEFSGTGYMSFADNTVMPTVGEQYGKGCAWANFINGDGTVAKISDLWMCATMTIPAGGAKSDGTDYTEGDLLQYSPLVIHGYGSGYIFIRADPTNPTSYRVMLGLDLLDPSTFVDTGIRIPGSAVILPLYIRISGAGLSQGLIEIYTSDNKRESWGRIGAWTGSLINYSNLYAVSAHNAFPGQSTRLYYILVSNYALTYAYTDRQTATALGTEQDWTGKLDSLALFPTTYNLINGLHTALPNQTVTFNFGTTAPKSHQFTLASAALMGSFSTDNDFTEVPIVGVTYDQSNKRVSQSNHQVIPSVTGGVYNWIFDTNPETQNLWTDDDLAHTEFGFKRIPPAGRELTQIGKMGNLFLLNNYYEAQFTALYGNVNHYLWSAQNLPPGMAIDQTGLVSGTPTKVGTWNVVIALDDGASIVTQTFLIYTTLPIDLATDVPPTAYTSNVYNWTPTVLYNPLNHPVTITLTEGKLPDGLEFNGTSVSGAPTVVGTFTFTLTVTDGTTTNSETYFIVTKPTVAIVSSVLPMLYEDVYFKWTPQVVNAQGPITYSYDASSFPKNVFVNSETGLISGTPTNSGDFELSVTVTDGFSTHTTYLQATVKPAVALIGGPSISGIVGTPVQWTPTIINGEGTVTVILSQGVLPPGLELNKSTGVISGTPVTTANTAVTLTVQDDHTYSEITLPISITAS